MTETPARVLEDAPIPVKLKLIGGEVLGAVPEYEACKQAADSLGLPLRLVYEAAQAAAHREYMSA